MDSHPQTETVLGTRRVFEGKLVQVRVDEVRLANGHITSREIVEHVDAVVVVPIDADDNVVLVRQYRHPVGAVLLEAPAGKLDGAEEPSEAAQRELQEEAGYYAKKLRRLGQFWMAPGYCTELMHAFVASDLVPGRLEADPDEDIRTEEIPMSRIVDLIRNGEIQDAKTIAALLMAAEDTQNAGA